MRTLDIQGAYMRGSSAQEPPKLAQPPAARGLGTRDRVGTRAGTLCRSGSTPTGTPISASLYNIWLKLSACSILSCREVDDSHEGCKGDEDNESHEGFKGEDNEGFKGEDNEGFKGLKGHESHEGNEECKDDQAGLKGHESNESHEDNEGHGGKED